MKKIITTIIIAVSVVAGMFVGFASTNVFADPEVVTVTEVKTKKVEVPVEVEVEKTPAVCGDVVYYAKRALNMDRRIMNEMNNLYPLISNAYRAGWYGEPTTDIDNQVYDVQAETSNLGSKRGAALDEFWSAERECMEHVLTDSGEGEDPFADQNVSY